MSCDGTGFVVVSSVISESEQDYVLVNWNGIRTMQLNVPLYQILRDNNLIPQHASMFSKSQQLPIYYSFNGGQLSLNQFQKRSVSSAEPCPIEHCYGDFINFLCLHSPDRPSSQDPHIRPHLFRRS